MDHNNRHNHRNRRRRRGSYQNYHNYADRGGSTAVTTQPGQYAGGGSGQLGQLPIVTQTAEIIINNYYFCASVPTGVPPAHASQSAPALIPHALQLAPPPVPQQNIGRGGYQAQANQALQLALPHLPQQNIGSGGYQAHASQSASPNPLQLAPPPVPQQNIGRGGYQAQHGHHLMRGQNRGALHGSRGQRRGRNTRDHDTVPHTSTNMVPISQHRERQTSMGYAETLGSNDANDYRASTGSKRRERSPEELPHSLEPLTKKQKTAGQVARGGYNVCAVCGAEDHRAMEHPYPNTKWGYLLCCVIHNTLSHSTADCTVFHAMTNIGKWCTVVERRQNKAPLYLGEDTPLTIIANSRATVRMLPDGTGPWSTQFAIDAVDHSKDPRSKKWFRSQRENEDRGFHCIKTDKGRKALHNLTNWSFTQCWDPRARYALYHNVAWPHPPEQEVRSELARLRALARAGNHYAPAPDWRWAPGLEVEMDSSPRNEDLHPNDAGEGPDSPPMLAQPQS